MYSLESLRIGFENPHLIAEELNRLYHRRLRTWPYNRAGIDIFDEDWDALLILDACRYDLFKRRANLPGDLRSVQSRGSATKEFLLGNFDGRTLLDTVYVTGSPMLHRHRDTIETRLHDVIEVWKESGWDENYRTVLPETMTDAALDARERYPQKRLVVHYLQPHYPFISPTGQEHFELQRLDFEWDLLRKGKLGVSPETVRRAYEENLDEALPEVERAIMGLAGTSVVTSDHGQAFGSRCFPFPNQVYGHPPGIYTENLVKVPWLKINNGTRPTIRAEAPSGERDSDRTLARERLRDLGYVN